MFLTRRWRFSAAVIAVVALTVGFSWWQYRERLRVRVVAENTTKAQELKIRDRWSVSVWERGVGCRDVPAEGTPRLRALAGGQLD